MSDIILVGNGPSVLENENGEKIDNFDIVVRYNWYHINNYEIFVGEKTDYWFTTVACPIRMKKKYKRVYEHSWQWDPKLDKNYINLVNNGFEPIKIRRKEIEEIQNYVGNTDYFTYSTGAISAWILLKEFNKLILTGFDWWENNTKHHYGDNQNIGTIHKPDKEYIFISKLLKENKVDFL